MQLFAADLAVQRKNFLYAEEALRKGNLSTYYGLKENLSTYPLYPYLQYQEILRLMRSQLPTQHVERFLTTYPNSTLTNQLRSQWLKHLAKQQQWALYKKFYKTSNDVALQCYAIWAEYKTTQKTSVLAKATPLWIQPRSQPNECNSLFAAWQKSQYFTTGEVWKRTKLAIEADQASLAEYLKRFLLSKEQRTVDIWLQVRQNPRLVTSTTLFSGKDPFLQKIQVDGLKRLMKRDPDAALSAWESIKNKYPFSEDDRAQVIYGFAIQFATGFDERAITWLNAVPKKDTSIYEWRVRYFLRQLDWAQVLNTIDQMPSNLQNEGLWRYWRARALLALDQKTKADTILKPLSRERTYHGMLASDLLNQPYTLNNAPYQVDASTKNAVAKNPAIARATELYHLKRQGNARSEWNNAITHFDEAQLKAAALLARSLNWYDRGILTATEAKDRNDLRVRFPLAYEQSMRSAALRAKIDVAWAFAIARQESAFVPDAHSPAGALGLMQLLPSTAQIVAKEIGEKYTGSAQLIIPDKNIRLGTTFLRDMSARFGYNRQLASAAYNAGPGRIPRWMPAKALPTDVWIETIPFKETRNYVQNVSSYWVIYNDQLKIAGKRLNHHSSTIGP